MFKGDFVSVFHTPQMMTCRIHFSATLNNAASNANRPFVLWSRQHRRHRNQARRLPTTLAGDLPPARGDRGQRLPTQEQHGNVDHPSVRLRGGRLVADVQRRGHFPTGWPEHGRAHRHPLVHRHPAGSVCRRRALEMLSSTRAMSKDNDGTLKAAVCQLCVIFTDRQNAQSRVIVMPIQLLQYNTLKPFCFVRQEHLDICNPLIDVSFLRQIVAMATAWRHSQQGPRGGNPPNFPNSSPAFTPLDVCLVVLKRVGMIRGHKL